MALDLDKLLSFPDEAKIGKLIEVIDRLNAGFDVLGENAKKSSEKYSEALNNIKVSTESLEKSLGSLDATNKKHHEEISKQAKVVDTLAEGNSKYTTSLKSVDDEIKILLDQQKKLEESKKKLIDQNTKEAGSIDALKQSLSDAVKVYNSFGDSVSQAVKDEQLKKINELSKAFAESDKAVKDARKSVEVAKGSYNDLSNRVAESRRELKAMEGGIGNNTKEFKALQKQINDDTQTLKDFDHAVNQDQRNVGNYEEALGVLDDKFGGLITTIKATGAELVALSKNPWFLVVASIVAAFSAISSAAKTFYTYTIEGEEALEKQTATWDAFFIVLKTGWASVGKAANDFFGDKLKSGFAAFIAYFAPAMLGVFVATEAKSQELAEKISKLYKDHTRDLVHDANVELRVNKLLADSKDELKLADEERLAAIREARKEVADQLQRDVKLAEGDLEAQQLLIERAGGLIQKKKTLAEYTDEEIIALGVTKEEITKLANLEATLIRVKSDASVRDRVLYEIEQKRVQEIEKRKIEASQREIDAERQTLLFIIDARKRINQKIIDDENSTLRERNEASKDNYLAEIDRLKIAKQQEVDIVTRAAEERIRAEGKAVTESALTGDKGLAHQIDLINQKYIEFTAISDEAYTKSVSSNVFKVLSEDAAKLHSEISAITDTDLLNLNNQLANQEISLKDYEKKKQQIIDAGNRIALRKQIEFTEDLLKNVKSGTDDEAKLLEDLAKLKLQLSDSTNKKLLEYEKEYARLTTQLKQAIATSAQTIISDQLTYERDALNNRLTLLKERFDQELKLAGDNDNAKLLLSQQFARQENSIRAQQAALARRQAIFDKAVAILNIGLNTSVEISKHLGNPFLIALIAGIGAAQLAAVLAKPIPAFAEGTKFSPEGPALVGEAGRELSFDRKTGKVKLYDVPTVTYLNKGTEILNNKNTEKFLQSSDLASINNMNSLALERTNKVEVNMGSLEEKIETLTHVVRNKKETHYNNTKGGIEKIIRNAHYSTKILDEFYG